jgi:hypothetical protein
MAWQEPQTGVGEVQACDRTDAAVGVPTQLVGDNDVTVLVCRLFVHVPHAE